MRFDGPLPHPPRTERERLAWLRLIRSENVGPATFFALLRRFGDAQRALDALPQLALRGGRSQPIRVARVDDAQRELETLAALQAHVLALGEEAYPPLLAATDGPPPLLFVKGDVALLRKPAVAIIGARNASAGGVRMARVLAEALGRAGLVIVSGLARGIDTAAHEGALATGTVGVLAGGIDVVYPPENGPLYEQMAGAGALVSEMAPGTAPQARHFPRRNRLISGLSRAVIVVEAAERSGSLITAGFALEQGRDVMAVPGSPLDPRCRGANRLIREGALLVQDAADVLDALSAPSAPLREPPPHADMPGGPAPIDSEALVTRYRPLIVERLSPTPIEVDELIRQTGAPASVMATVLLELELAGRLVRAPGQRVSLL